MFDTNKNYNLYNECVISLKTDVWAFGCIILQLITGKHPYFMFPNTNNIWGVLKRKIWIDKISPLEYIFEPGVYEDEFEIIRENKVPGSAW